MVEHPSPDVEIADGDERIWQGFWSIRKTLPSDTPMTAGNLLDWGRQMRQVFDRIDSTAMIAMDAEFRATLSEVKAANADSLAQEQGRRS